MSTVGQMNLNVQGKREIHPYFKKKFGEEILTLSNANAYSLNSLILFISDELLTQWINSSREISCWYFIAVLHKSVKRIDHSVLMVSFANI